MTADPAALQTPPGGGVACLSACGQEPGKQASSPRPRPRRRVCTAGAAYALSTLAAMATVNRTNCAKLAAMGRDVLAILDAAGAGRRGGLRLRGATGSAGHGHGWAGHGRGRGRAGKSETSQDAALPHPTPHSAVDRTDRPAPLQAASAATSTRPC
jgi:hypothetical protein